MSRFCPLRTGLVTMTLTFNADHFNSLIAFTDKEPKDFMVPSRWGTVSINCRKIRSRDFTNERSPRSTNAKILTRPSNRVAAAQ